MKTLIQAIAVAGAVAAPALAQEAPPEAGARLDALTCREFLALGPRDRGTMMLALRAHLNGDPLPDGPLPIAAEPGAGDAGEAGDADAASDPAEDPAAGAEDGDTPSEDAEAEEPGGDDSDAEETDPEEVASDASADDAGSADGSASDDAPSEEAGEDPADPLSDARLTGLRTSCQGAPDALAADAMRAAHADYD